MVIWQARRSRPSEATTSSQRQDDDGSSGLQQCAAIRLFGVNLSAMSPTLAITFAISLGFTSQIVYSTLQVCVYVVFMIPTSVQVCMSLCLSCLVCVAVCLSVCVCVSGICACAYFGMRVCLCVAILHSISLYLHTMACVFHCGRVSTPTFTPLCHVFSRGRSKFSRWKSFPFTGCTR
jgi:hypothetical protein